MLTAILCVCVFVCVCVCVCVNVLSIINVSFLKNCHCLRGGGIKKERQFSEIWKKPHCLPVFGPFSPFSWQ